jgi:hypothetical protein
MSCRAGNIKLVGKHQKTGQMPAITLISNSASFYDWEADWVSYLLGDFDITHVLDATYSKIEKNPILVLSGQLEGEEQQIRSYVRRFRDNGFPVGIIHLSDEWLTAPVSFYQDASFVFRNYYRPDVMGRNNCHYLPLGYRAGFASKLAVKEIGNRAYTWVFAGAMKASRATMLDAARRIPGGRHHVTDGAYDPTAGSQPLPVNDYAQLLGDAVFALCPRGNRSLDCFRLYEALDAGCIPIVEDSGGANEWQDIFSPASYFRIRGWRPRVFVKSIIHFFHSGYWSKVYGDFPCPTINHWQNLGVLLKRTDVERTSRRVRAWWGAYKKQLRESVRNIVVSQFGR